MLSYSELTSSAVNPYIELVNIEVDANSGLLPKKDYSVAKHAKIASIRGHILLRKVPIHKRCLST